MMLDKIKDQYMKRAKVTAGKKTGNIDRSREAAAVTKKET